jgi:predicted metal-dependent HD superfamily phosphohydrolase
VTDLEAAWARLFPDDRTVGADLLARWAEPHRRYHTVEHLAFMLGVIDRHADRAEDADAVRLAAWFHDAIYDPRASDNEERSAQLAAEALTRLHAPAQRTREVVRLVGLTKDHKARTGDRDGGLLCDADLAILAEPPERYRAYARSVREEYSFVPEELFLLGRRNILRHLLDLPALFHVVPERHLWTARAHTNMRAELDGA